MAPYFDLSVGSGDSEETIKLAKRLGWTGICLTADVKDLKTVREGITAHDLDMDILLGAVVHGSSEGDLQKKTRQALDIADLILFSGGGEPNRVAAENWEVDILSHPERGSERDLMDQRSSGVDDIISRLLAEHTTAVEFNLSSLLSTYGMLRAQVMGRMTQNILLSRKYGVPMILTSGAVDRWGLRAPRDLAAVGRVLGMTDIESKKAVSSTPQKLIQKARDRQNPNILTAGLKVIEWGTQKPQPKKKYGWY
jgi:RNase P/RNase MRP subunit p30